MHSRQTRMPVHVSSGFVIAVLVGSSTGACTLGCSGSIGDPGVTDGRPGARPSTSLEPQALEGPRAARLTHEEWERTTVDLLSLGDMSEASRRFLPDVRSGIFDDHDHLQVGEALASSYREAAEALGRAVAEDETQTRLALRVESAARIVEREVITSFLERAFRRPPTVETVDAYTSLVRASIEREAGDSKAGVRWLISATLQSPRFLYRLELENAGSPLSRLNDFEIASRLSYSIWGTMPDDRLFEAARRGSLGTRDGVTLEASRMLDDPRASAMISRFHTSWMDADAVAGIAVEGDASDLDVDDEVKHAMRVELERFAARVFDNDGGLREILTTSSTHVEPALAPFYGLDPSSDLGWVDLDPTERSGVMTQIGFLARTSTASESNLIRRGVFIARRLLCVELNAPLEVAVPDADETEGGTMRDILVNATEGCGPQCHGEVINPLGFPFESFDFLGRYRTQDRNGFPVDSSSFYAASPSRPTIDGAVELSTAIAEDPRAHHCYARHWISKLTGRAATSEDEWLIRRIGDASYDGASAREIVLSVVSTDHFLARPLAERSTP